MPSGRPNTKSRSFRGRAERAFLPSLFDFDPYARAEHLAGIHNPVDCVQGLFGRSAVQRVADCRAALRADDQGNLRDMT